MRDDPRTIVVGDHERFVAAVPQLAMALTEAGYPAVAVDVGSGGARVDFVGSVRSFMDETVGHGGGDLPPVDVVEKAFAVCGIGDLAPVAGQ